MNGVDKERLKKRRLAAQAALFEDLTEDMLRRADLHAGMQVLDVGCGVGDVSLLAARIVGPSGAVVGIDRASPSVQTARQRATAAGAMSVHFEETELENLLPFIERGGIATAEQIGIETLADRLRHDAVANERVTFLPRLVSAWSRFPT